SLAAADGGVLAAAGERQTVTLDGERFVRASLTLGNDEKGGPVTLDLLRSVTQTTAALQSGVSRAFLLYGALAVALAALAAAMASRSVLRSFRDFVGFMGSVAESRDYSKRFED